MLCGCKSNMTLGNQPCALQHNCRSPCSCALNHQLVMPLPFTTSSSTANHCYPDICPLLLCREQWWELSWDVMEPIAYILSLMYAIVGYLYFLATRGSSQLELGSFKQYWSERLKLNKIQQSRAFDEDRWAFLNKQRQRLQQHLRNSHRLLQTVITKRVA